VQFVYYLCVRSEKELQLLKVGDIIEDGELFAFRAEATKSDRDELIPIDPNLKNVMVEMGLFKAPKTDFIFSTKGRPDSQPFGKNFFARRFRVIRKMMGLSTEFTLYGWKHTRCVHLVKAGVNLVEIMKLCRHRDIATTAKYIRSLGLDIDAKELQSKTQKI
jgi:integrase